MEQIEKCPDCNVIIEKCLFCWEKDLKNILRGK